MKIWYKDKNFRKSSLDLIRNANIIIADYRKQGYELTLRQLYYQLVSRNIIANSERSYTALGNLINDARLAGLIDWNTIVDRTRFIRNNTHWQDPQKLLRNASLQFDIDKWAGQEHYVEVWVEKDALIEIVGQSCTEYDVPFFSCRGYVSQSEMWQTSERIYRKLQTHNQATIIHLGDHDPSGIDMSRDISERIRMFLGKYDMEYDFSVKRIALEMEQIEDYSPPPNPAKTTDSRFKAYLDKYGVHSWELDALEPKVISSLIEGSIENYLDIGMFNEQKKIEEEVREELVAFSSSFESKVIA